MTKKDEDAPRRRNTPTRLSAELPALTRTAFRNSVGGRGFAEAGLITEWPAIVGRTVAGVSQPLQLAFPQGARKGGTLTIGCGGAAALELQHLKPQILERINAHFGYAAVTEIRFRQGASMPTARKPRGGTEKVPDSGPPSPAESEALSASLQAVPEGAVKESLKRLGLAVRRRPAPR